MLSLVYNAEFAVQQYVANTKNIFTSEKTPEDDCSCHKCENVELMLISMKNTLLKHILDAFVSKVKPNADLLIATLVCSVKNYSCCSETCTSSANDNQDWEQILAAISLLENMHYKKWMKRDSLRVKSEFYDSGCEDVNCIRELTKTFRTHMYNIYRQYSELKYLKKNQKQYQY